MGKQGINIEKLPSSFIGTGEVKGFTFERIKDKPNVGSLFKVNTGDSIHYEVIKSIISPKCIDFENRIYSDTEFKEVYPKSSRFGIDGWSCYSIEYAIKKLESL